ncbi:MAG TPA: hypothetical protein VF171_02215 [Trueperaceae bacterium]
MTRSLSLTTVRLVSGTALTLAACVLLPVAVHLIPAGGVPLGARLLPIFLAPLLAAYLFPPVVALAAAALAPFLNQALTGMPPKGLAAQISVELLVFVGLVVLVRRMWPRFLPLAPLAYLAAHLLTALLFGSASPGQVLADTWSVSWPGLLVLTCASAWLARYGKEPGPREPL